MRPIDMHRYIGFTPKRRSCSEKDRYSSREDAVRAAREHNWQYVCGDMVEYRCDRHQAWHIGHRDKHRAANEMLLTSIVWFQAQFGRKSRGRA